jgi:hypothetical protein
MRGRCHDCAVHDGDADDGGDIIGAGGGQWTRGRPGRGMRAAAARLPARIRVLLAAAGAVAVALGVAVAVGAIGPGAGASADSAPIREATSVPASVLDSAGTGGINPRIVQIYGVGLVSGSAIPRGGKPQALYVGADYCPYCAIEQWALVVALSRFGTISGLSLTRSSRTYPPADIPELSFYRSRYTSRLLGFTAVDTASSAADPKAKPPYVPLQTLTAAQRAMMRAHDPEMAVPFLRIGNYVQVGTLIPAAGAGAGQLQQGIPSLSHKTWAQVAAALHDPASPIGRYLDGFANFLTAAVCKYTGNQPAGVCTAQIRALETDLVPTP